MGRRPTVNLNLPRRLRVRQQKNGKRYYYYDTGEKPRREIPLGANYVFAIKQWAQYEANREYPYRGIITFRYVAERYQREVLSVKEKIQDENSRQFEKLFEFFDNPPALLDQIEPMHIRQYLDWRKNAPIAANREKALFSRIWDKALEWGYTSTSNPCRGIQGFKAKH